MPEIHAGFARVTPCLGVHALWAASEVPPHGLVQKGAACGHTAGLGTYVGGKGEGEEVVEMRDGCHAACGRASCDRNLGTVH
jgi:hypothetical protein